MTIVLLMTITAWLLSGFLCCGIWIYTFQTRYQLVNEDEWKGDVISGIFIGLATGPIGFIVMGFLGDLGLMYWPPNYHNQRKLSEVLSKL